MTSIIIENYSIISLFMYYSPAVNFGCIYLGYELNINFVHCQHIFLQPFTMDPKEAERIFTLTKSPHKLLQDQKAVDEILKYVKDRETGDSKFVTHVQMYQKCQILLGESTQPLTEDEFHDLRSLGIGARERQELSGSVGADRTISNRVIQQIQQSTVNKIAMLTDLQEFTEYVFGRTNAK